ncbi:MAG: NUDIX domain-containing protein [Acidobacteria bacterium]|nr:NUDIX domain-containing protein [Acidobacteriota bacterium]
MSAREYPERPLVGVGAAIVDGVGNSARVLLARRGRAPSLGEWSIPGGLVKVGETLEQALIREVREETGLRVRVIKMIEVLDRIIYQDEDGAPILVGDAMQRMQMKQMMQRTGEELAGSPSSAEPHTAADPRRVQYHYVIIDYVCRLEEDSLPAHAQASSDAAELRWALREELSQYWLHPALLRVLGKSLD